MSVSDLIPESRTRKPAAIGVIVEKGLFGGIGELGRRERFNETIVELLNGDGGRLAGAAVDLRCRALHDLPRALGSDVDSHEQCGFVDIQRMILLDGNSLF